MGRNIDVVELLGLNSQYCPICKYDVTDMLEEVDLDCDVKSRSPQQVIIYTCCSNCDNDIKMVVDIETRWERDN